MSGVEDLVEVHSIPEIKQTKEIKESSTCRFSMSAIPETKKQIRQLAGIPLGVSFSPFLENVRTVVRNTPVQCIHCKSYISNHCKIDSIASTINWNCLFCGKQNVYSPSISSDEFQDLCKESVSIIDPIDQPYRTVKSTTPFYCFVIDGNITGADFKVII